MVLRRAARLLVSVVVVIGVLGCSGGGDYEDQPSSTTAFGGGGDDAVVGRIVCDVIRDVQSRLDDDATPAVYLTQFANGITEQLGNHGRPPEDALAKRTCPKEYARFLRQADITSIAGGD